MRIALAQFNATVGDIDGNAERILDSLERAAAVGAELVLVPELAITGYPPEDLLHRTDFVQRNRDALDRVAGYCTDVTAVIGFVDRDGDNLYNAAAVCRGGAVTCVYRKRRLPNYGVFDERRYFSVGEASGVLTLGGLPMALTVCEDIWVPELAEESSAQGARVLLNISASPFHVGKGHAREEMLAERARANGVWLVYCNAVGGQDELVFDGRSLIVSPDGEIVARAVAFEDELLVVDVPVEGEAVAVGPLAEHATEPEELYRAIGTGLRDYVRKNGFSDVVLGLSGGIDSALTAAIAADFLGPEHVHGVLMPSRYSSAGSVDDSLELARALGIDARTIPIEGPHRAFEDALADSFEGLAPGIAEENLQARVRGTLVMALSNKFGWLALATGNKSELSVGYSTLYGDMVGGFAPIKDVFKTRVYELARWRNEQPGGPAIPQATIDKAPSAELRPDQVDQDSLPPYDVLDAILHCYVERDMARAEIVSAGFDDDTVARVIAMTDAAEYKRRQGPLGVKITPKAFGKDRRMPVTNRFRG